MFKYRDIPTAIMDCWLTGLSGPFFLLNITKNTVFNDEPANKMLLKGFTMSVTVIKLTPRACLPPNSYYMVVYFPIEQNDYVK